MSIGLSNGWFCCNSFISRILLCLLVSLSSTGYSQVPVSLPWTGSDINGIPSILEPGITAVTCGTNVDFPSGDQYVFGLFNLNGSVPGAGRSNETAMVDVFHHPSWVVDSIGNVFGIAINTRTGDIMVASSSNFGSGFGFGSGATTAPIQYGIIGGEGVNSLAAAGTIYKLDGVTGQASVFSVLPQQSSSFTHVDCEVGDKVASRTNTGVGLGNIVYDEERDLYYVSNIEDGRIYRLSSDGSILDSYDPGIYDDGVAGISNLLDLAYGLALSPSGEQLFFGGLDTPGSGAAMGNVGLFSIDLNPDGSFVGDIDNTFLHPNADYSNYVEGSENTEIRHVSIVTREINDGTFVSNTTYLISDLHFTPDGNLLAGIRVGCDNSWFRSYNHFGETNLVRPDGNGVYNIVEEYDISVEDQGGTDDGYGGVAVYDMISGIDYYAVSSADILSEAGPHGIAVFRADANTGPGGSGEDGFVSPLGAISYGQVDMNDPKGVGGELEIFSSFQFVPCTLTINSISTTECEDFTYSLEVDISWSAALQASGGIEYSTDGINYTAISDLSSSAVADNQVFSINNLQCESASKTLTVRFTDDNTCMVSRAFAAVPIPCSMSLVEAVPTSCDGINFNLELVLTWANSAMSSEGLEYSINGGGTYSMLTNHSLASNATNEEITIVGLSCDDTNKEIIVRFKGETSCNGSLSFDTPAMNVDFGDLPDTYGTSTSSNGPSHAISSELYLGSCVDSETDGQPESMAGMMTGGDDHESGVFIEGMCASGDEDGIILMSPIASNQQSCVEVSVHNATGSSAQLQGWIDFNGDGVFGAGEELNTLDFSGGGATIQDGGEDGVELCFISPANTFFDGDIVFARFRLSANGGLASGGDTVTPIGEVEDYKLNLLLDFGDLPDTYGTSNLSNGPSHVISSELYLGSCVDSEIDGQPESMAGMMIGGDDHEVGVAVEGMCVSGDEDGIILMSPIGSNQQSCVEVSVHNATGSSAQLQGWIDFNGDGVFGAGEELNTLDFSGGGATIQDGGVDGVELCFISPANTFFDGDIVFARFRLSANGGLASGGDTVTPIGEVEDYKLNLLLDFGDLPDSYSTSLANNGPSHVMSDNLFLGSCVDSEIDGQPEAMAGLMMSGDDHNQGIHVAGVYDDGDEDGIFFLTPIIAGSQSCINVTAHNATGSVAQLQGWIDFNGNGSFESNEELNSVDFSTNGVEIPVGDSIEDQLCFDIPASADFNGGPAFARFRLSASGGLSSSNDVITPIGEVEDYKENISALGNIVWVDSNVDGQLDPEEERVENATITLYDCSSGEKGEILSVTTTDDQGEYVFLGLTAGTYCVQVDVSTSTHPDRDILVFTYQDNGVDISDSDVGADGCTNPVILGVNEVNLTVYAGVYPFICPILGGPLICDPLAPNIDDPFVARISGLENMSMSENGERDFGITFVVFPGSKPPTNHYDLSLGQILGTVPYAQLQNNHSLAVLEDAVMNMKGVYVVCAILDQEPLSAGCRPVASGIKQIIPTLGEWGILCLMLLLMICSVQSFKQRTVDVVFFQKE